MRPIPRRTVLTALTLLSSALAAAAHEDDPKILDRKAAVQGPGYRTGVWGRGGGFAAGALASFPAHNATLLAWLPLADFGSPDNGNSLWGYTSPSGREYALFGSSNGLHVVEITHPGDPVIVGFINGPDSLWRDVRVRGKYAYAVSEGGGGIQVIDLGNVDAGQVTLVNTITTGGVSATHTVNVDETSGFLYRCGGAENGLRIYDLANRAAPVFVGTWADRYVHEAQVKTFTSGPYAGKQLAFCCGGFNTGFTNTGLSIVDVTDKANPIHRGQVSWPGAQYSHQAWLSENGQLLYLNDELDEDGTIPTKTIMIDVSNIDNPIYKGSFTNGNTAVGHNLYVKGNLIYEANYRSGLRVFDATNPLAPVEVSWFDTDPSGDGATFNGLWNNYPFFQSGVVIGSDIESGLFVLWMGAPLVQLGLVSGAPALLHPSGTSLPVTLTELSPGAYAPGTAKLHYDAGAGAVTVDLVDQGGGSFLASFPPLSCGASVSFYLSAESTNGVTWVEPPNGAFFNSTVGTGLSTAFSDGFETSLGWTVGAAGDDATTGIWVRANPNGTAAQPEDDHTAPPGTLCFFTGQGPAGGSVGESDVDGGKTTLVSPTLNLSAVDNPQISYWRWYSNTQGGTPGADVFVVQVSGNGGASWTNVETVGPTGPEAGGGWFKHQFKVADFVVPTANVKVRFVASDEGSGSVVEAAVDDFALIGVQCEALTADVTALAAASGGTVHFDLAGGAGHANDLYLLLGTLSGTVPGFDVGAVHVPLVQDVYFNLSLTHANQPPLIGSFGVLDGAGDGSAQFALPPGFLSLVGLQAHHAWVAIEPATLGVTFASNAVPLAFQ